MSVSSIDHFQRRGLAMDIIDEAIAAWEQWYLDDDYDAKGAMDRIIERMKERRAALECHSGSGGK